MCHHRQSITVTRRHPPPVLPASCLQSAHTLDRTHGISLGSRLCPGRAITLWACVVVHDVVDEVDAPCLESCISTCFVVLVSLVNTDDADIVHLVDVYVRLNGSATTIDGISQPFWLLIRCRCGRHWYPGHTRKACHFRTCPLASWCAFRYIHKPWSRRR